jgi:acyl-homoserine lactone synthase
MRIEVVERAGRAGRTSLLNQAFALRHRTFVEHRGWEMLRRPDALDIDRHDLESAVHFLAVECDRVAGYVRLVPGTCDMVAARADTARVRAAVGEQPVYTVSRFCVDRECGARKSIAGDLLVAALEYVDRRPIGALLLGTDSGLIFVLRAVGIHLEAAGSPVTIGGRTHQSVLLRLDSAVLPTVRRSLSRWNRISGAEPAREMAQR